MKNNFKELYKDNNKRSRRTERINVSVKLREERRKDFLDQRRKEAVTTQTSSIDTGFVTRIVNDLGSNNYNLILSGSKDLFELISQCPDFSLSGLVDFDVVGPLFGLLSSANCIEDKLCAAVVLSRVFEHEPSLLKKIQINGHFEMLFCIISTALPDINEQLFNIITLIANFMPALTEQVFNHGFIDAAYFVISKGCTAKTIDHISSTLSTLTSKQFGIYLNSNEAISKVIFMLDLFLQNNDQYVFENGLKALSNVTSLSSSKIRALMQSGILHKALLFLDHTSTQVLDYAILVFGNIVSGDDENTQRVLDMGAIDKIFQLLNNEDEQIRKHVLWSLSNVCAGTLSQVDYMYKRQMFYQVYNHFLHDTNINKREALWVISNILYVGSEEHIRELMKLPLIKNLCEVLRSAVDKESVLVALDSISFIFERSGYPYEELVSELRTNDGDDLIYELCDHPSNKISSLSNEICQRYLDAYDVVDNDERFGDGEGIDFM